MKDDDPKDKTVAQRDADAASIYAANALDDQKRGPVAIAEHEAHLVGGDIHATNTPLHGDALDNAQGAPQSDVAAYEDAMRDAAHVDPKYLNPQISGTLDAHRASSSAASNDAPAADGAGEDAAKPINPDFAGIDADDLRQATKGLFGKSAPKVGEAGFDEILTSNKPSLFGAADPAFMKEKATRPVAPPNWDPAKDKDK